MQSGGVTSFWPCPADGRAAPPGAAAAVAALPAALLLLPALLLPARGPEVSPSGLARPGAERR